MDTDCIGDFPAATMPTTYCPVSLFLLFACLLFFPGCLDSPRESFRLCMEPPECTACYDPLWRGAHDAHTVPFEERLRDVPADIIEALKHTRLTPASPFLRSWAYIVLHHSATARGSAESFDKIHKQKGWDGLGYHFVIGNGTESKDGEIEVGFRWKEQREGAHAGNTIYNELGIGICLVGNFETALPTQKQCESLHALLRLLTELLAIPTSNITKHQTVREEETACPGKLFPFAQIVDSLAQQ
jgi:N-acetyl-anhydromuramyl-L-alanine amidase AmpD